MNICPLLHEPPYSIRIEVLSKLLFSSNFYTIFFVGLQIEAFNFVVFLKFSNIPIFLRKLSLEPSLILTSWFLLLSETYIVSVYYWECAILFISTWLGYSADRYLEPNAEMSTLSDRHLIFKQLDKIFKISWLIAMLVTSYISIYFLNNLQLFLLSLLFISTIICLYIAQQESKLGYKFIFFKEFRTAYILSLATIFFFSFKPITSNLDYCIIFIFFFFLYLNNLLYTNIYELSYDQSLDRISFLQRDPHVISILFKICFFSILCIILLFLTFHYIIIIASIIVLALNLLLYKKYLLKNIQIDTIYWVIPLFLYFIVIIYSEI